MSQRDARLTIQQLGEQVARALSVDYAGPPSGQVRAVPDARTIRYYASLGLVDKPAEMRGRTALYDERHLLQVVAIKRLQEQGRSLAEIQAELTGASNARLADIARVPEKPAARRSRRAATADRASFWSAEPAEPAEPAQPVAPTSSALPATRTLIELELAPGVRLQLETARGLEAADLQSLHAAASSLVEALGRRGLLSPG